MMGHNIHSPRLRKTTLQSLSEVKNTLQQSPLDKLSEDLLKLSSFVAPHSLFLLLSFSCSSVGKQNEFDFLLKLEETSLQENVKDMIY